MTTSDIKELASKYDVEKIMLNGIELELSKYAKTTDLTAEIAAREKAIAELKASVIQQTPLIPELNDNVENALAWLQENGDQQKLYVLPDGYIYAYMQTKIWQAGSKNLVPLATASGGGVYNSKGYVLNKRLNSSAAERDISGAIATGFIPVKKNDILRIKYFACGASDRFAHSGNHICLYNASYTLLTTAQQGYGQVLKTNDIGRMDDSTGIYTVTVSDIFNSDEIAYVRISTVVNLNGDATDADAGKVIVTINEEIKDGSYVDGYTWASTGLSFTSANYEPRIKALEDADKEYAERIAAIESGTSVEIPNYWMNELKTKADAIQVAMESAGSNKSAFLWYTDAHWQSNSKMSPLLLEYLSKNTPINKVNFGGDIVGDPASYIHGNVKYVHDWRSCIANLPNHHSVYGNHDVNHRTTDVSNMAYALLLADEETMDMVIGDDSCYYIDCPAEKTRYLYLSYMTNDLTKMLEQGKFIVASLIVPDGWHIVAIAHRWWQYTSSSNPTVGTVPSFEKDILSVFDAYNARSKRSASNYFYEQDFTSSAKGKVEFCIGGHIHVDYDFTSEGSIPIIITAADTNQERVGSSDDDCGILGTTTESAVYGIIADYNDKKITIIGIGRGNSRVISLS